MFQSILPDTVASEASATIASLETEVKQDIAEIETGQIDTLIHDLSTSLVQFAIHLGIAILVFYAGRFVINKLYNMVAGIMLRRKVDRSLSTFVLSLIRMVLFFLLIIIVIGIVGIETSSFIALFASAGVAIGMALSGTLQNFAGGVLILLLKPYKIGDYIEAQGYAGTVTEIQIFSTIICTPDNKSIIIPNGGLSTSSINNWSREEYRRVDWSVGISYGDSVAAAREALFKILETDSRIVRNFIEDDRDLRKDDTPEQPAVAEPEHRGVFSRLFGRRKKKSKAKAAGEPAADALQGIRPKIDCSPRVFVAELADSSVNLTVRAWARSVDYWGVYYEILERIYTELPDAAGVSFPFPQMDVHMNRTDTPES